MSLNFIKFYGWRNFSKSSVFRNIEKSKQNEPVSGSSGSSSSLSQGSITSFIPSEWDKKVLVWSGRYKLKDIPPRISFATIDNARSRLRIRLSNFLMISTLFLCGYYVWVGKEKQKKGDSFTKRELERQQMYKDQK